ncbi:AFR370Cp [Eremothecium gossypii ATCC 10895]|uniref:AP complex subunit sigma n=1 Tax=Eremothecium gossypii (strain ATCC 10895 / CBS 109.51 / FGSC 9923 / NRRL Y-1056) TaxID=284811 RepID=Q753E6_EREGS|nr:AFR370Cp [Eremothecium gossypii ATCC 10895]AAS53741.1 AFR370Cp [Eremothecium gossypii ATCC 10895]AEY98054.1 FAFR370Cp [Eremothecium gossypii FDAG1]
MPIQFILCFNKQGIIRLCRWFDTSMQIPQDRDQLAQIFKLIMARDPHMQSNFIEFSDATKLVYKRYAGLYFLMGVGPDEDSLIYLAHIQLFVEVLDLFFGNVCELDILFNFYKAYMVMDEMFVGGELRECSKDVLLERITHVEKLA